MILQQPPTDYDANYEIERNRNIESEDLLNRKKQQDIEIAGDENLILSSPKHCIATCGLYFASVSTIQTCLTYGLPAFDCPAS